MRRTSKLRQGHTIYIATVQYDSKLGFMYGMVTACFITGAKRIGGNDYVTYKSNDTLYLSGYLPRNCSFHCISDGINRIYFSRNHARHAIQHYAMLLNHALSTTQVSFK